MSFPSLIKPAQWAVTPGLVAPEWRWFWRDVGACYPFWNDLRITDLVSGETESPQGSEQATRFSYVGGLRGTGIARTTGGGGNAYFAANSGITQNQYTLMSVATITADVNNKAFIDDDAGSSNRKFQFRTNTAEAAQFIPFNTSNSAFSATGTTTLSTNVVIARVLGNIGSIWVDGINEAEVTISGTPNTPNARVRLFDRKIAGFVPFSGTQFMVALFNSALSDHEIRMLSRDPFGPFRMFDEARVVYALPAVGGLSIPVAMHQYRRQHQAGI